MPNYKVHVVGGASAFVIVRTLIHAKNPTLIVSCEWLLMAVLGSLFPDVDTKSKGQKIFYSVLTFFFCYYVLQNNATYAIALGFIALLPLLVRHRGLFHRVWFIFSLCFCVIAWTVITLPTCINIVSWDMLFFSAGALSHIWLDIGLYRILKYK